MCSSVYDLWRELTMTHQGVPEGKATQSYTLVLFGINTSQPYNRDLMDCELYEHLLSVQFFQLFEHITFEIEIRF